MVRAHPGQPNYKERNMSDGGKGSRPRPFSVSQEEWNTRWDAIFQRDLQEEKQEGKSKEESIDQRLWKKSLENMSKNGNETWGD